MNLNSDNSRNIEEIKKILDYQPSGLSNGEIDNADAELEYFFVNFPLHEARANIKELYEGWVHFEAESPEGEQMTDMLFFFNQMITFLNLSYVVIRKKQTS
ncbi:hypothetical protein [Pedobacter aquatilis]|uniref:hypothetical protein n=1 Tax=Pedobacter aquatilis TaxID=351343 RepID=UPI00292CDD21|nr:hypothetical protein [Pedobacter aquatilis]